MGEAPSSARLNHFCLFIYAVHLFRIETHQTSWPLLALAEPPGRFYTSIFYITGSWSSCSHFSPSVQANKSQRSTALWHRCTGCVCMCTRACVCVCFELAAASYDLFHYTPNLCPAALQRPHRTLSKHRPQRKQQTHAHILRECSRVQSCDKLGLSRLPGLSPLGFTVPVH